MSGDELQDLPADPEFGPLSHAEPGVVYGDVRADGTMPALARIPLPKWATAAPIARDRGDGTWELGPADQRQ